MRRNPNTQKGSSRGENPVGDSGLNHRDSPATVITDGYGFWAGDRIHRDPNDRHKIIPLWSTRVEDAHNFKDKNIAEFYVSGLRPHIPGLRVRTIY